MPEWWNGNKRKHRKNVTKNYRRKRTKIFQKTRLNLCEKNCKEQGKKACQTWIGSRKKSTNYQQGARQGRRAAKLQ